MNSGGGAVREELPMNTVNHVASVPAEATESVNPGVIAQVACCAPPPSYHNINLPVGHPSALVHESGAPPSYEEAIDPNGTSARTILYDSDLDAISIHLIEEYPIEYRTKYYFVLCHRMYGIYRLCYL